MKTFISAITTLIVNKSAETDYRLTQQGLNGKSAHITGVEMHASQRPEWLRVFRFEATFSTAQGDNTQLSAAMRSDEREGESQIQVDTKLSVRDEQLAIWSEGLITLKRHSK